VITIKIAYLAPEFLPTWGGVGSYSYELVRNLDAEVHVITPYRGYSKQKIESFFNNNVTVHFITTANDNFIYNMKFQLGLLNKFPKLHKKYAFDLIHAANLVHMPDIFLKFRDMKIPTITTVHTTLESQSTSYGPRPKTMDSKTELLTKVAYPYIHTLEKIYLKKSKNLIAVSEWIKGFLPHALVINNGVDTKRFVPVVQKNKQITILFAGRLLALKGIEILIEAIRAVVCNHDVKFLIAGTGNTAKWKKQMRGISKSNYDFCGYVPYEKMHELYSKADIFVLPSFTESFPLTVLEAMSCGLPVIASDIGGIPEIIKHGSDGFLFRSGNSAELANLIVTLISNPEYRQSIGNAARQKIVAQFDSALMAKRTQKYYELVANA